MWVNIIEKYQNLVIAIISECVTLKLDLKSWIIKLKICERILNSEAENFEQLRFPEKKSGGWMDGCMGGWMDGWLRGTSFIHSDTLFLNAP